MTFFFSFFARILDSLAVSASLNFPLRPSISPLSIRFVSRFCGFVLDFPACCLLNSFTYLLDTPARFHHHLSVHVYITTPLGTRILPAGSSLYIYIFSLSLPGIVYLLGCLFVCLKDSPFWRSGGREIPKIDGKVKRDGYSDLPVLSILCFDCSAARDCQPANRTDLSYPLLS